MESTFDINLDGKTFHFSIDKHGLVWLIENENENSNFGQERPVKTIEEAKETAKLMLYASGRIQRF
jgi:hypothetical protein